MWLLKLLRYIEKGKGLGLFIRKKRRMFMGDKGNYFINWIKGSKGPKDYLLER